MMYIYIYDMIWLGAKAGFVYHCLIFPNMFHHGTFIILAFGGNSDHFCFNV